MQRSSARHPRFAPIPRRIPPLTWRRPFALWTPAAAALAIGWPALAIYGQSGLAELSLICGALGVAAALAALGAAWAMKRPPRTRVAVVRLMLLALLIIALATPFVTAAILTARADQSAGLDAAAYAMAPLALMLGLPIALFSGLVFSVVALVKPEPPRAKAPEKVAEADVELMPPARDVQPFY